MYSSYREGGSLVKPLFFDYPEDDKTYENIDTTFMLGDAIKVSPVLEQGKKETDQYSVYFPKGVWIDLHNPTQVIDASTEGKYVNLNAYFS